MDNFEKTSSSFGDKLSALLEKIPGYKGYAERSSRREADAVQREFLAKRLTDIKGKVFNAQQDCLADGNLEAMEPCDRVLNVLDRLIERVRHASRGYAGFFDAVKVNEVELMRIYEYDLALVNDVNLLEEAVAGLHGESFVAGVRNLRAYLDNLDGKLNERERILKGVE